MYFLPNLLLECWPLNHRWECMELPEACQGQFLTRLELEKRDPPVVPPYPDPRA